MAPGPGGKGLSAGDPKAAADDGRASATTDKNGQVSKTTGDHREDSHNQVSQTQGDSWVEVKGNKNEVKMGAFLELIVGMKHTMVALVKTGLDLAYNKTNDIGPYTTEMFAAKYERLGSKNEKVMGKKTETWTGYKYEKTTGNWVEANAKKRQELEAKKKAINDALHQRAGAMLEEKAASCKQRAEKVRDTVKILDRRVSSVLRLECETARERVRQFDRDISNMEWKGDKFEQKMKSMDAAVGSLMAIDTKKIKQQAANYDAKASVLKFTSDLIKLGE